MKSNLRDGRTGFVAGVILISLASHALAQSPRQSSILNSPSNQFARGRSPFAARPAFSPYLNLFRQGDPVVNYYGLVKPEKEFRATNDQFQRQLNEIDRRWDMTHERDGASNLGVTGHHTRFLSDPYGGTGSVMSTLTDRDRRRDELPPTPGSRIAPSGHSAYFNNHGTYYTFPGRR